MANRTEIVERKIHELDATGKTVGRLATVISHILQGKHKPTFLPNLDGGDSVLVIHASQMRFRGKKLAQKMYYRHSGYLGNLKIIPMRRVFETEPEEVLRMAVKQMLPKNRLAPGRMKRLTIKK